jgi:hypothetical protein
MEALGSKGVDEIGSARAGEEVNDITKRLLRASQTKSE